MLCIEFHSMQQQLYFKENTTTVRGYMTDRYLSQDKSHRM